MKKFLIILLFIAQTTIYSQDKIVIDGNFDDWHTIPVGVVDSVNDVHDTEGYVIGRQPSEFFEYSDVDLLEVKFANDDSTLYVYMKATGLIGQTSAKSLGHERDGRYYFIVTLDVDDNDTTGYRLSEGGYYPDDIGYDMNMEVEFYAGAFNTGHYLNHEYLNRVDYEANWENDLAQGIVRLAPGTYDWYSQWVMFSDSSYVAVKDKGPVYQGIIEIAVSEDGHEAEMSAPFWGFLKSPDGENIIDVNRNIIVSASLEASGELSEEAARLGYTPGSKSNWGSDTADPFSYFVKSSTVDVEGTEKLLPETIVLNQNYPNPFNPTTVISFALPKAMDVNIAVYNSLGQKVKELVNSTMFAGNHSVKMNGADLTSGLYFYRISTPEYSKTMKMMLVK